MNYAVINIASPNVKLDFYIFNINYSASDCERQTQKVVGVMS